MKRASALLLLVVLVTGCSGSEANNPGKGVASTDRSSAEKTAGKDPEALAQLAAEDFLNAYVQSDGRVARTDQGNDTVSEGQAYALLLSVGINDEKRFANVWTWTQQNLQRSDGLLSWQWKDGKVVDDQPASDADLDAARALLLAAERFDKPSYRVAGQKLSAAVLEHETIVTPSNKRHLVAGPWAADKEPAVANPSYFSPRAYDLIVEDQPASPEWKALRRDDAAQVAKLTKAGLAPDWAAISKEGVFTPSAAPDGTALRVSFDGLRLPVRLAESCRRSDRALAGAMAPRLRAAATGKVVLDRSGKAQSSLRHPLAYVAAAAASDASGENEAALNLLDKAQSEDRANPTYYGAAWLALGRMVLTTDKLGSC